MQPDNNAAATRGPRRAFRLNTSKFDRRRRYIPEPERIHNQRSINVLTAIGCACFAFDDIAPLRAIGGGLLASPGWPFLAAAVFLVGRNGPKLGSAPWWTSGIIVYGFVLSIITTMFLPETLMGGNVVEKMLRLGLTVIVWVSMPLIGFILAQVAPRSMFIGAGAGFSMIVMSLVLAKLGTGVVENSALLHSIPNLQQRVRGTRYEPSSLGGGYIALGTFLCLPLRGRLGIGAVVVVLLLGQYLTASRGTALVIGAVVLLALLALLVNRSGWTLIAQSATALAAGAVTVILILSFSLTKILQSPVWNTIGPAISVGTTGTSDATRAIWAATALDAVRDQPFGLGFVAYLDSIQSTMRIALEQNQSRFLQSELTEVFYLINTSSDYALAPKTLPALAAIHLGVTGIVALGMLYTLTLRSAGKIIVDGYVTPLLCAIAVALVGSTFLSSLFLWEQPFMLGAVLGWSAMQTAPSRHSKAEFVR